MNVGDLLLQLSSDLGKGLSPNAETRQYHLGLLNAGHRAILREPGLSRLRQTSSPITLASEVGRAIYGLPPSLMQVVAITERDSDRRLESISISQIREFDPGLDSTGTPEAFIPLGYRVLAQPPESTGVWAASSSASDVQSLQINGIRSGGLQAGDVTTTLTGVTRVALGSLTDYVDLVAVSLNTPAVGVVSLFDAASSGNTLAQIGPGQTTPQYFVVQLYPEPSAVVTYYVDGVYRLPALTDNTDVPLVPEDFHDLLTDYARWKHYEMTADADRAQFAANAYTIGLKRLKHAVAQPAETFVMGRHPRVGHSRYGGMFPATNW